MRSLLLLVYIQGAVRKQCPSFFRILQENCADENPTKNKESERTNSILRGSTWSGIKVVLSMLFIHLCYNSQLLPLYMADCILRHCRYPPLQLNAQSSSQDTAGIVFILPLI